MIDLNLIKNELSAVSDRASNRYEAEVWGTGQFDSYPFKELLPDLPDKALEAAKRLAKMAQSLGPRVVGTKKYLTLGEINWGGDNSELDALIKAQDIDSLADEILEQSLYSGIMAGIVRRGALGEDENGDTVAGEPVIEPLYGHIEPLFDSDNPNQVAGIFQAWLPTDAREPGWRVRIYDFAQQTMREWHKLKEPWMVGGNPVKTVPRAPMPRYQVLRRGRGRLPIGDIELLLPLLKSDWSSQVRGDRAEENTAFAQLVIRGKVTDGTHERSPSHVITVEENGGAEYLTPGDLSQIHNHHDRKLERIREDANLPAGFSGVGETPSGRAFVEGNARAISDAKGKDKKMARLLTDLVSDFAKEHNAGKAPEVSVSINKEFEAAGELDRIVMLYDKGLLEHGAAVRAVSAYVSTWSDSEIEAFIKEEKQLFDDPPKPGELGEGDEQ